MADPFADFAQIVRETEPRAAVVLGSGLGGVTGTVREIASVAYGDVPGFMPAAIHGHRGRLVLGDWDGVPALIAFGRLHFYEGHAWNVVTGLVRAVAALGVPRLVLTNAAGGIHPTLVPGSLMAIRGHIKFTDANAWRKLAEGAPPETPYSPRLLESMREHAAAAGQELLAGIYAAQTGPTYETCAEVRALKACGADAAGMSTAMEAEAAVTLGMEVAAISCITNKAAGLSEGPLNHTEVLANAKLAVGRLGTLIRHLIAHGK